MPIDKVPLALPADEQSLSDHIGSAKRYNLALFPSCSTLNLAVFLINYF